MASSRTIERIAKLLRRALDQQGKPEGETCRRLAERLMAEHGVSVVLEEDGQPEPDWPSFGIYSRREAWRDAIASLVGWLYDLAIDWRPTLDGRAELLVEPDRVRTEAARATYRSFCLAVEAVVVPPLRVFLPRDLVVQIYRAGIAVGIAARFSGGSPFNRAAPRGETAALERLRAARAPRKETPVAAPKDVPIAVDVATVRERAETRREDEDLPPEEVVWVQAFQRGTTLWVPAPARPRA